MYLTNKTNCYQFGAICFSNYIEPIVSQFPISLPTYQTYLYLEESLTTLTFIFIIKKSKCSAKNTQNTLEAIRCNVLAQISYLYPLLLYEVLRLAHCPDYYSFCHILLLFRNINLLFQISTLIIENSGSLMSQCSIFTALYFQLSCKYSPLSSNLIVTKKAGSFLWFVLWEVGQLKVLRLYQNITRNGVSHTENNIKK